MTRAAKLPLTSETPLESRLAALSALIPEAFSEGKVDFDKLRSALGAGIDTSFERYGLTWAGKSEAIRAVQIPSKGTLEPVPEQSVNFGDSQNLIIEGDNLEVLKLLQKSYYGAVKMIYIDPPYNTGNEFIYPDNFREGLEDYLLYSGQRADDGTRLSTSEEAAGRKHSRWLTMMYPRLFLARNLLREDGVLCVSIDDNEVHNLRHLMDEVFGLENHLATIVWQKRYVSNVTAKHLSDMHDFIVLYAKDKEKVIVNSWSRTAEQEAAYKNPDNDERGLWRAQDLSASKPYNAGLFTITGPKGQVVKPPPNRYWRCNERQFREWDADNRIWWGVDQSARPMLKAFLSESERGITPHTWWDYRFAGHNKEATLALKELFDDDAPFDTPKPAKLIQKLIQLLCNSSDIVLDFFAGSGTVGEAVLQTNQETGSSHRYILVQLPEKTDRTDYPTIADITRERVRRVIAKLEKADEGKLGLTPRPDRGFKAFRLSASNFKVWDAENAPRDAAALAEQLELFTQNVAAGSEQSVLFELVLKSGFLLTAKIERLGLGGPVYAVEGKALYICLANPIMPETLTAVADAKPERFICLDVAFEGKDELKTNAVLQMRDAGITFHTA